MHLYTNNIYLFIRVFINGLQNKTIIFAGNLFSTGAHAMPAKLYKYYIMDIYIKYIGNCLPIIFCVCNTYMAFG